MSKTQAEYQKAYRKRKKLTRKTNASLTNAPETNAPSLQPDPPCVETVPESSESTAAPAVGPLDVYSESRWSFLQSRGHVWNPERRRSFRPDGIMGVTVPGDPGYEGKLVGYAGSERARVEAILERESSEACQVG